ncbi:peptidyl-prolyl cis-trans isomerase CYP59-like [Triticum dicoccoides]|uniref:peptidyl-prolyl cis-trans isomerase CYP59-like n=1 Tax=Triticum dicoccoides TaxID=85692 RepID=UPI001890D1B3|nr:peptidyl-prolyl cis-trans isomerase CYP59-like [Triticum dicoccoides]
MANVNFKNIPQQDGVRDRPQKICSRVGIDRPTRRGSGLEAAVAPRRTAYSGVIGTSVLIITSVGDIDVDLHTDKCPLTTKNFLKLCKIKYYNGCLFYRVDRDFLAHTGDLTGTGTGGDTVYKLLHLHGGDQDRFSDGEIRPQLRHSKAGTVAMAGAPRFYFTLRDGVDHLDDKHTVFGMVPEGRPFMDIRIKHTYVLDDPFDDPPQLAEHIPGNSPIGKPHAEIAEDRLDVPSDDALASVVIVSCDHCGGHIPGIEPPDNVVCVCNLNPITQDEDLDTIFSRFGTMTSAEIIRDCKTGDSLCYAFIEFEAKEDCEHAYFKIGHS